PAARTGCTCPRSWWCPGSGSAAPGRRRSRSSRTPRPSGSRSRPRPARRTACTGYPPPTVTLEAEGLQVVILRLLADVVGDLRHTDVGRVRDDARDGVPLARRPFRVLDDLAAFDDLGRDGIGAHRRLPA